MSTTDIQTIEQSLVATPAETEHRLVAAVRSVARRIVEKPEIVRALAAAESIAPGIVVTEEVQAVEMADAARLIILGEKAIDTEARAILRIPAAMTAAVKASVADEVGRLGAAKLNANNARVAWQGEVRRRAAAAEAAAREQVRKATEEAAAEAAVMGEDAPPPAEVAQIVVPRTVAGGIGKAGTMVRIKAAEIVDFDACPNEWLTLIPAIAVAVFNSDVMQGKVKKPAPGESVVWRGVRFEAVESAVNR